MIEDRFVKLVLSPLLLLIVLVLVSPALISTTVIVSTDFLRDVESEYVLFLMDGMKNFDGIAKDIIVTVVQVLPALIAAICFQKSVKTNIFGKITVLLLVSGACLGFANLLYISPNDTQQVDALTHGKDGLINLKHGCEDVLRNCIAYILLISGLNVTINNHK